MDMASLNDQDRLALLRRAVEYHPGVFSKVIFNVFSDADRKTYAAALSGRMTDAAI